MDIVNFLIVILTLFIVSFYVKEQFVEIEYVKSDVDDNSYLVRNEEDNKEAANLLAKTNRK